MIRALRAEWYKLWRRGMVLGGLGAMVGVACLVVILIFANAKTTATTGGDRQLPTLATLATARGLTLPFSFAGTMLGVISLVLFASSVGGEYRDGTLKMLLSREPRRVNLLAGKLVALCGFVAVGIVAAFLGQTLVATLMAGARGVSTSEWWTGASLRGALDLASRTVLFAMAQGMLGAMLAILFRASAPAIGSGIAYALVGENLILLVWSDGRKWLPGQVLGAYLQGGTAALEFARACVLAALYVAAFALVCASVFRQRDVTS